MKKETELALKQLSETYTPEQLAGHRKDDLLNHNLIFNAATALFLKDMEKCQIIRGDKQVVSPRMLCEFQMRPVEEKDIKAEVKKTLAEAVLPTGVQNYLDALTQEQQFAQEAAAAVKLREAKDKIVFDGVREAWNRPAYVKALPPPAPVQVLRSMTFEERQSIINEITYSVRKAVVKDVADEVRKDLLAHLKDQLAEVKKQEADDQAFYDRVKAQSDKDYAERKADVEKSLQDYEQISFKPVQGAAMSQKELDGLLEDVKNELEGKPVLAQPDKVDDLFVQYMGLTVDEIKLHAKAIKTALKAANANVETRKKKFVAVKKKPKLRTR